MGVYVFSMQRNVGFWDVGEMQTVPYILGVAHPTGFPAFTLIGWLFTHLVPAGTVAWRMTLLCALATSGAAFVAYFLVREHTDDPWIAMLCAWCFAFTAVAWTVGTRTEVHAFAIFFVACTVFCALRWSRTADSRWLFLGAVAWALGVATHPVAATLCFGLLVLLLVQWERISARALCGALVLFVAITALFYAYLPLRSAQVYAQRRDPTLSLGVGPGRPFWDYDHPAQRAGFVRLVTGSDFSVGDGIASVFLPQTYSKEGPRYGDALVASFTWPGLCLILAGAFIFVRRDKMRALGLMLATGFCVPFALGFHEEADVLRYFLPSFLTSALLIGVAAAELARRMPRLRPAVIAGLMVVVAAQVWLHADLLGQRFDPGATRYIAFVRAHTERNALLIVPWTYATALAYAAYVDRNMDERIVETAWLSDDIERVPTWIARRPIYVIYLPWGDLPPGYHLQRLSGSDPGVFRLLRARAKDKLHPSKISAP